MKINVTIHLPRYIAHPYWPEREKLINIQKESGINRVRSMDKRERALDAYLKAHKMKMADYEALEKLANRPFYTWADVLPKGALNGREPNEIVISAHQLHGCLAQAATMAPASVRLARAEQIRTVLQMTDCATGKTAADGVWERFVVVKAGTGNRLSNQRALRSDPYLENVTATGAVSFVNQDWEPKVRQFLEYAGREIGVGAARKLGWGRFTVQQWTQQRP